MYTTLQQFLDEWRGEAMMTESMMEHLTDESLDTKVHEDGRTLGFIAWHIVQTLGEMMSRTGLEYQSISEDTPIPSSAKEIARMYGEAAQKLAEALGAQWTDESLDIEVDMYGEKWQNRRTLHSLIKHQVHHRGQMSTMMRFAGLTVPGTYGPSKEEWAKYGLPPHP
ncbi:MAG: hypothetical protein CL946_07795 [Ectothiorhodospiraceae bacterium]|nr:hypothetical protein [Ectothiorhodospiraceae bacterium]